MASFEPAPTLFDHAPSGRPGHVTVRNRFVELRLNHRVLTFAVIAAVALLVLTTWAMTLGSYRIPFADVFRTLVGEGTADHEFIVETWRLPRVLSALLVGIALAMSGAIFQGLVRNPLVSPDIIGVNSGATAFAVYWIVTSRERDLLPVASFLGAVTASALIYALAWKDGININRLILVGIGVSAVAGAATTYLVVRATVYEAGLTVVWTVGSFYDSNWWDVRMLFFPLLVLVPVAVVLTWSLRALQLGDDAARGLGVPLERMRLALVIVGCALAAIAVAIAGPVGFVALMVPHAARLLAGPMSGSVLLFTGVLGAILVLSADTIGQHLLPVSLPVGIVTSAIGAPYFLFLLYKFRQHL